MQKIINCFRDHSTTRLKWLFLFTIFLLIISAITALVPIKFVEKIVNSLSEEATASQIVYFGCLYVLFQVINYCFQAISRSMADYVQYNVGNNLQLKLFRKLMYADLLALEKKNVFETSNILMEDCTYVNNELMKPVIQSVFAFTSFCTALIYMLTINIQLTFIMVPLGIITAFASHAIQKRTDINITNQRKGSHQLWKVFLEGISGIKTIRVFQYKEHYTTKVQERNNKLKKINIKQSYIENISENLIGLLFMLSIGTILIVSAFMVHQQQVSIGSMLAILLYNHMLTDPFLEIVEIRNKTTKLRISLDRIYSIFSLKEDSLLNAVAESIDTMEVSGLSFAYENKNIIDNLSFTVTKPANICIMGPSGCGKSTLAKILSKLYDTGENSVEFYKGGQSIAKPHVSYLMQDAYLFDLSIEENIKLANPNITRKQFNELISLSCLENVLERHQDIPIGMNGSRLSGGERKRVLIAQTLAKPNTDILLFDELSSSLDISTAEKIFRNLADLRMNKICIFIEHSDAYLHYMNIIFHYKDGNFHKIDNGTKCLEKS